ncbi:MAG: aminoacyl-tRNA hydrolase [Thermoplasmata archaeon]
MPGKGSGGPTETKMVLILRGELRLTPGKAAVPAAHAAVLASGIAHRLRPAWAEAWTRTGQKKIALLVPTLAEIEEIRRRAVGRGIPAVWVEDAGFTEVAPGTKTCLGLGPAPAAELDPITGDLDLY